MSNSNNFLSFRMTSTISLTSVAKNEDNQIYKVFELGEGEVANISQVFLMTYSMLEKDNPDEQVGIVTDAGEPQEMYCYLKKGTVAPTTMQNMDSSTSVEAVNAENSNLKLDITSGTTFTETANFFEINNNQNLISYLADSTSGNAVTIQTEYDYLYGPTGLAKQFPNWDETGDPLGTKVIGYSNISSSSESAAYSATSKKIDDGVRYYTQGTSTAAILTYNMTEVTSIDITNMNEDEAEEALAAFEKEKAAGKYRSLGINATTDESGHILSQADYDAHMLSSQGDYIELTLTLSKKSSYVTPTVGNPAESGTPLKIDDYLSGLKIYGIGTNVIFDQDKILAGTATPQDGITTTVENIGSTNTQNLYRVRIRRNLVEKLGEDDDGRYKFRLEYDVKTGDGTNKWNKEYSNYKVSLTAAMYNTEGYQNDSYAYDHLIYTNAKIEPNVIG